MTTYLNVAAHAIDLPTGELLAPSETCELDDELAAALVAQGALSPLAAGAKSKPKKEPSE